MPEPSPLMRSIARRTPRHLVVSGIGLLLLLLATPGWTRILTGHPENYRALVASLKPGDTLHLAPGEYRHGLRLHGIAGTPAAPIVIRGPAHGDPAVFVARRGANTVSIVDAAYVELRDVTLDGRNIPVDAVKLEGTARFGHHITLENLTIVGHGASQQNVAISTKAPAWGWVLRANRIHGAGTGMYLGNSDGSAPFFDGIVERNLVTAPLGYAIQIKHQRPRPALDGAPQGPSVTIIRHNVLSKAEGASTGPAARPILLLGHFPRTGPGERDEYHVYGNFLDDNPTEALFQAEGNVAFYSNVLRNRYGPAIAIQPHNDVPKEVRIFDNTIVARGEPIVIRTNEHTPVDRQFVHGNAVFAPHHPRGGVQSDNLVFALEDAPLALTATDAPRFDPYPRDDALRCAGPRPTWADAPTDARCDFNGRPRQPGYCGAYAGQGTNPGWLPALAIKPATPCKAQ